MGMYWRIKQGEVGKVLTGVLSDEDGELNLTGWTVTVTASPSVGGTPVIDDAACTVDPDQSANRGKVSLTLNSTTANIAANENGYLIEFTGVTPGGAVIRFPNRKSAEQSYGRLVVRKSL